jgi:DUF1009 family protein
MNAPRRIGILAGGGSLPREVADGVAARGLPLHIVAIDSETDADFGPYPVTRIGWGEIGRMIATFRETGCSDLVIIGSVKRPDLATIKPDLGFFRALATVARLVLAGGDDKVLRGVIGFFEKKGLRVVGPGRVAPELIIGAGGLSKKRPDQRVLDDARRGFDLIAALGAFDIGQAAVVADGVIEAIEGAEGTDGLLRRLAEQRRARGLAASHPRGVLVKRAKPTQDERIDLPVIGPGTITRALEAGLAGIVVEAGRVLAASRAEMALRADASDLFIAGLEIARDASAEQRARAGGKRPGLMRRWLGPRAGNAGDAAKPMARRQPPRRSERDIAKGLAIVAAMRAFGGTRAVVVVRGHVLAVESGEGVAAAIERAGKLRQWGDRRTRWRSGVVALAAARECTPEVVALAARAGFAGFVVGLKRFSASVGAEAIAAADKAGIFIVGVGSEEDGDGAA